MTLTPSRPFLYRNRVQAHDRRPGGRHGRHPAARLRDELHDRRHRPASHDADSRRECGRSQRPQPDRGRLRRPHRPRVDRRGDQDHAARFGVDEGRGPARRSQRRRRSATATPTGPAANVLVFTPDRPLAAHTTYSVTMSPTVRGTDGQAAPQQGLDFHHRRTAAKCPQSDRVRLRPRRRGERLADEPRWNEPARGHLRAVAGKRLDVSGDGTMIAYGAGGVVKRMSWAATT